MELPLNISEIKNSFPELFTEQFSNQDHPGILISNNVILAHAALKQEFGDRKFNDDQWGERHPSAVIHPTAKIGRV